MACDIYHDINIWSIYSCKAGNATDLMQVVDFADLIHVRHRVALSLLASSSYIKCVKIQSVFSNLWQSSYITTVSVL